MAIQFLLRDKDAPEATIYFRYRSANITAATPFKINPQNFTNQKWDEAQIISGARTAETKARNQRITNFNNKLEAFRIDIENFISDHSHIQQSEFKLMLKDYISKKYFAHRIAKKTVQDKNCIPDNFTGLIDFYIQQRSIEDKTEGVKPLAENTVKKYRTLQTILKKYDKDLHATAINDVWRLNFVQYLNGNKYSENTQIKYIKDIKMLCLYANKDNRINKQVLAWKINANPKNVSEYLTFSFEQLEALKNTIMPTESLDNVRDWLLVSCYTSVRVSELLKMRADDIEQHGEDYFITVFEPKTGNSKMIFLLPQVVEILNKRNGQFPRKISEPKYNEYIKKVCEVAGMTHEIQHGVMDGKRKVIKKLPFHKFVTSHSGRATFVTLFKDRLPNEILQMQTNHHSVEMLEHYDKTEARTKLLKRGQAFANAYKESGDYQPVKLKIV